MHDSKIETERLVIRDWQDADWSEFFAHTNTDIVMRWLGGVLDQAKMVAVRGRLESYQHDHGFTFWPVIRKSDGGHLSGELLGFCGLKRSNQKGGPQGEHEIGWRFREDCWGMGYAREAALAVRDYAFATLQAPHVIALTVMENRASWGLMLRIGMERREDLDFANADFGSDRIIVYAMDRNSWEASQ